MQPDEERHPPFLFLTPLVLSLPRRPCQATSKQLRDDLMTMLIAGHETTAAVLTWTFYELAQQPELMARVQREVDDVLQGREPTFEDMMNLPLIRLCLAETLRMYPEPPLLIRRALEDDILPKGGAEKETYIPKGTDVFIATWNIQRSELFWEEPLRYNPDRFLKNFTNPTQPAWAGFKVGGSKLLYPNEVISDFAFLPFGGGSRKCVGDQFAMMEATATLALLLQRFDLSLAIPAKDVGMRTGATIHTENGLMIKVKKRIPTARHGHGSGSGSGHGHGHGAAETLDGSVHHGAHAHGSAHGLVHGIAAPAAAGHGAGSHDAAAASAGGCPFHQAMAPGAASHAPHVSSLAADSVRPAASGCPMGQL